MALDPVNNFDPITGEFKYAPQWQGPLSGRSFEKQTEDAINWLHKLMEEGAATAPSDALPKAPGTPAPGISALYSRGDHVHPVQENIMGNAATADKLKTARVIALTGDVTGEGYFDGAHNLAIETSIVIDDELNTQSSNPVENSAVSEVLLPLAAKSSNYIDVKSLGAVGDGVTDDSAVLRTALQNYAGHTIYFPAGTYLCTANSLVVYSNTTLFADKGVVIRRGFNTSAQGTNVLLSAAPLTGENTIHDIAIQNIIFDGNGLNFGDASFDLTFFSSIYTENLLIENCDFLDVVNYHAIDLNRCHNTIIRHCRFLGFNLDPNASGYDGFSSQREAIQFDIGSADDDNIRSGDILIEQCYFGASDNFGSWYAAIGNHGFGESGPTTYFDSVVIRNNIFDLPDSVFYALHLYVFTNVIIEGNKCLHCRFVDIRNKYVPAADAYYHNSDIRICNNYIDGIKADGETYSNYGIYAQTYKPYDVTWDEVDYWRTSTENLIISENIIKNYSKGIYLGISGTISAIISENVLEDCGNDSATGNTIYLYAVVKQSKVVNNVFKRSGAIFVAIPSDISDFSALPDIMNDLIVTGNSWVDPSPATRTFALNAGNVFRGLIISTNIIDDSNTTRGNYEYFSIAGNVIGGIIRDNYVFTKSDMLDAYTPITYSSGIILMDNFHYYNDVLASIGDNSAITDTQIEALFPTEHPGS